MEDRMIIKGDRSTKFKYSSCHGPHDIVKVNNNGTAKIKVGPPIMGWCAVYCSIISTNNQYIGFNDGNPQITGILRKG
eukprot:4719939-Ditylum_brightwellii.AAC.1